MQAKIKNLVAVGAIASSLILPAAAFAQTGSTDANTFCVRLPNTTAEVNKKLADLDAKRDAKKLEVQNSLKSRQAKYQATVEEARTSAQNTFNSKIAELEAKATTDAQKQAVATYKTTMEAAQATRRAAVDKAQADYRTGVNSLTEKHQAAVKTATETYKTSVKAAVSKANSDCASGVKPNTARQTFTASVKAADEKLNADIKAVEKIAAQVDTLAKTRNNVISEANKAFRETLAQATKTLQAAFGR